MTYDIIRSRRRTMAAQIKDGRLIVRAPLYATDAEISDFVRKHQRWIEKHIRKAQSLSNIVPLTPDELRNLAQQAKTVIPQRVAAYAPRIGVDYGRITIRTQHSRWGSCSSKGNLNFNCLLMLTPPEVLDSVVVHELCHRKEMNHSPKFYAEVLRVCPDYQKCRNWLRENGPALMRRIAP